MINQVDANIAFAAVRNDDVGVDHGGRDEVVERRLDVTLVLKNYKINTKN